jgi:phosphatidylglycerophosphate synthase
VFIAALATGSFATLTHAFRQDWTPSGRFGSANLLTAGRFLLTILLLLHAPIPPIVQASTAGLILLLDGVDGYLARRFHLVSRFGETVDQEVDAFFTLALCITLYQSQRFGVWVLIPGALRYLFVLFIRCADPPASQERSNRWSRAIGAVMLSGLSLSLLPIGSWAIGISGFVTAAVVGSFAHSFWRLYYPCPGNP